MVRLEVQNLSFGARVPVGVFGESVGRELKLREGDRVEIYRPLLIDPKEARRRRAGSA